MRLFFEKLIFTDKNRRMIQLNKRYCYASSQQWSLLKEMTKLQVTFFPLFLWNDWFEIVLSMLNTHRGELTLTVFKKTNKLLAVYWYYSWMVVRNSSELAACLNVNAKLQLRITLWNHPHVDVHSAFLIWRQFCFMAEHLGFNLSKTN